jgi:hypothetical protein
MALAVVKLAPAEMAVFQGAIDSRLERRPTGASADAPKRWSSLAHQRSRALRAFCRDADGERTSEIVLHVRGDGCTMDDGTPISEAVVARIAPNAFLRALIHDAEGRAINASGRRRHPSTRQKRLVQERDRRCVDCGSTEMLELDHDPPFDRSRRTVVDELRLRCANCHHRRHRTDHDPPS